LTRLPVLRPHRRPPDDPGAHGVTRQHRGHPGLQARHRTRL